MVFVLVLADITSLVGLWLLKRWSVPLFFVSSILLLAIGAYFYSSHPQYYKDPEQLLADLAVRCFSAMFVFTIAFLPYRKELK